MSNNKLQDLMKERDILESMYIIEKQIAMQRSDYKDIEVAEKQHDKSFESTLTMSEKMKLEILERKGKNPTKEELSKAIKIYSENFQMDRESEEILESLKQNLHFDITKV